MYVVLLFANTSFLLKDETLLFATKYNCSCSDRCVLTLSTTLLSSPIPYSEYSFDYDFNYFFRLVWVPVLDGEMESWAGLSNELGFDRQQSISQFLKGYQAST